MPKKTAQGYMSAVLLGLKLSIYINLTALYPGAIRLSRHYKWRQCLGEHFLK